MKTALGRWLSASYLPLKVSPATGVHSMPPKPQHKNEHVAAGHWVLRCLKRWHHPITHRYSEYHDSSSEEVDQVLAVNQGSHSMRRM